MTYKDILRLSEGVHVVTVNTERCMVVRLRDGYTLTTILPGRMMLIQRFSERGHLLWEERVEDIFSATEDTTQDNTQDNTQDRQEDIHEDTDC